MTEVIEKVNNFVSIEVLNRSLSLIEKSMYRLLQVEELCEKTQSKLRFLGFDTDIDIDLLNKMKNTDTVLMDLLSDAIVFKQIKEQEMNFLAKTEACLDLVLYGKLSWESYINNDKVLLSWQIGDGHKVVFFRKTGDIFENRVKIKV